MISFAANDVLEFAIRLEENGEHFYLEAAKTTADGSVKELFESLAKDEISHKKIFLALLSKISVFEPPEGYPGEYLAYLQNYMDGKVIFTKENSLALPTINNTLEALDFAIQREMDAIFYYQELKPFVAPKDHKILDAIIEEERRHFASLSTAKKEFKAAQA